MKGAENIEGLKVGFVLEGGYNSTTGKLGQNGGVFGREAVVYVGGNYGTLYAGRLNSLLSDGGSIQMTGGMVNTFDAGGYAGLGFFNSLGGYNTRYDQTIAYKTPVLGGFQAGVQASNVDTTNGSSSANRYFSAVATYKVGNFGALLGADYMNKATVSGTTYTDKDDAFTVLAGGNYNFGAAKLYLSAAYFKHYEQEVLGNLENLGENYNIKDAEGYTVTLSADASVLGGTLQGSLGYTDGDEKDTTAELGDFKIYNVAAQYSYNLAKSTKVYAGAAYRKFDADKHNFSAEEYTVAGGIVYYF